jgi:hypothetical protein
MDMNSCLVLLKCFRAYNSCFQCFGTVDMNTYCSCAHVVVGEWSDVEQNQLHLVERPIGHSSDVVAVLLWYIPNQTKN